MTDSLSRADVAGRAPWWLQPLLAKSTQIRRGRLALSTADGERWNFQGLEPGPEACITVKSPMMVLRVGLKGDMGLAESYIRGEWESDDLVALLELGLQNERELGALVSGGRLTAFLDRLRQRLRRNSRPGSRRNIRFHYDVGNDFYRTWLDSSMTYSSALFEADGASLEAAQQAKYARILDQLQCETGEHILEIGCGWGGFAEYAGRAGLKVTGITVSPAQYAFCRQRIREAGLADRVSLQLTDYRDIRGQFDHLVSIEMFEAVGEAYWPTFFQVVRDRLRLGGRAALQVITIDEAAFPAYRSRPDFIQIHVFPGGMLPTVTALRETASRAGLALLSSAGFGPHYARTLALWSQRFKAAGERLSESGLSARFLRLWEYYLAYCEAGFRTGRVDLMQVTYQHDTGA